MELLPELAGWKTKSVGKEIGIEDGDSGGEAERGRGNRWGKQLRGLKAIGGVWHLVIALLPVHVCVRVSVCVCGFVLKSIQWEKRMYTEIDL